MLRAESYFEIDNFTSSEDDYSTAISNAPSKKARFNAYYHRGLIRIKGNNPRLAEKDFDTIITKDNKYNIHRAYYGRFKARKELGNDKEKEAMRDIEEAIDRFPIKKKDEEIYKIQDWYYEQGNLYYKLKKKEKACDAWEEAFKRDHKNAKIQFNNRCGT